MKWFEWLVGAFLLENSYGTMVNFSYENMKSLFSLAIIYLGVLFSYVNLH